MQVIGGFFLSQKMSLSIQNLSVFESKEYSYLFKKMQFKFMHLLVLLPDQTYLKTSLISKYRLGCKQIF